MFKYKLLKKYLKYLKKLKIFLNIKIQFIK